MIASLPLLFCKSSVSVNECSNRKKKTCVFQRGVKQIPYRLNKKIKLKICFGMGDILHGDILNIWVDFSSAN